MRGHASTPALRAYAQHERRKYRRCMSTLSTNGEAPARLAGAENSPAAGLGSARMGGKSPRGGTKKEKRRPVASSQVRRTPEDSSCGMAPAEAGCGQPNGIRKLMQQVNIIHVND